MKGSSVKRAFRPVMHNSRAFSMVEVLVSMAVLGIIAVSIFAFQTSSWKRSTNSNRTIVAGHMIERQIEVMRMNIDQDPVANFPAVGATKTIEENGITLMYLVSDAYRPSDGSGPLDRVRKCDFVASWGKAKSDSLKVTTFLSKMF